jgi:hypothetical protein
MHGIAKLAASGVIAAAVLFSDAATAVEDSTAFFTEQVKPILEANCFTCHGGQARVKGDFRITSREGVLRETTRGPAVNLDQPAESAILKMISYADEHHQMPPSGKLAQTDIDTLTAWVEMGAPWFPEGSDFGVPTAPADAAPAKGDDHWAYQPLTRPEVPRVSDPAWQTNPIDAFIRKGLDAAGLEAVKPASRQALIRRVYYDVLGLPPNPAEVERFIQDERPDAYAHLVEELLASPHYGERWARHWLDVVGYAETHGFERDSDKPFMWRYRDYVINAFNSDKPYDQFVREQIAGDEMPGAGPEQRIATGLYRLGIWDDEPADKLQGRYDELDGMIQTISATFLGTTLGCARCHDHKIDPFPTADYYSLVAFLQGVKSSQRISELTPVMTPEEQAAYDAGVARKNADIVRINDALYQAEQTFLTALNEREGGENTLLRSDLVDLQYRFYRDTWSALPDFEALRPESEGKLDHNFVTIAAASRKDAIGLVFLGKLRATEEGDHQFQIKARDGIRLSIGGSVVYESAGTGLVDTSVTVRLWPGQHAFRVDYFNGYEAPVLDLRWSGPSFAQRPLSLDAPAGQAPDVPKLIAERGAEVLNEADRAHYAALQQELKQARDRAVPGNWATTVTSIGPVEPDTHILLRGNPHVEGDLVLPRFPGVLKPPEAVIPQAPAGAASSGRRTVLAEWLSSPENPLAARVMVNRIWQYHFGRGIVRTSNDFGTMGKAPTHPELLDWLASEFIAQGWSMKAMHRLILLSNTYQMSSSGNAQALAADPENDLFWRFDMRRLEAEEVRDTMLAVNGSLNLKMGGPQVFPPMPAAVLATSSTPGSVWGTSPADDHTRRSIYTHVKRSLKDPLLADFDLADTESNCAVRFVTTQPTQALNLLNSEFVNAQAEALAKHVEAEGAANLRTKVWLVLNKVTQRIPDNDEVDQGLAYITEMQQAHGHDEAKAFERFCLLALNLNEFLYID